MSAAMQSLGPVLNDVLRKITAHAYGPNPLRVCRNCAVKQVVTPEQVSEWLVKGIPVCGRCKFETEIVRTEMAHTVAGLRAVTPNAKNRNQPSTQGRDGAERAASGE